MMVLPRRNRHGQAGWRAGVLCAALSISVGGCGILDRYFRDIQPLTRVDLINNGNYDVDVVMFIYDEQDAPRDLVASLGERIEVTVPAGQIRSIDRDCDDLQSVYIDDADLRVIGQVGPEANSDVLRDGSDFDCGDTIEFVFDHSDLIVDFDVSSNVQRR